MQFIGIGALTGDQTRKLTSAGARTPFGSMGGVGQNPRSPYQVVGVGALTEEEAIRMADERRRQPGR